MLILTRRLHQGVLIGDGVVVTVLAVDGERVKLGIEAPADVTILRDEVMRAVRDENQSAARDIDARGALLHAVRSLRPVDKRVDGPTPAAGQTMEESP